MNTPRRKPGARRAEVRAAERVGAVPVRSASFVSIMCDAAAVRERGLPVADYFLWNDDFEYSTRLIRDRVGLHVPASVVTHKTAKFGATDVDPGERFFFEVRNKVWLFSRSRSLSAGREGAVRRLHDPPLGTHRRPLRRPTHPAPGGIPRPPRRAATRPARQRRGPRGGRLDRRRPHARPRTAVLAADEHVRRRPARVPAGGVRLHRRGADPAAGAGRARAGRPGGRGARRRDRAAQGGEPGGRDPRGDAREPRPRPGPRRRPAGQRPRGRGPDGRRRREPARPLREAAARRRVRRGHRGLGTAGVRRLDRRRGGAPYAADGRPTRSAASSASATRSTTPRWSTGAARCWPPAATPTCG